jgi:hypothetical protein
MAVSINYFQDWCNKMQPRRHRAYRWLAALQLLVIIRILVPGAEAQKIKVEFDKNLDFATFKTYSWAPIGAVSRPMLVAAIRGAVDEELVGRGLKQVHSSPDLWVEMYGSVDSDMAVSYSDLYSGYGGIPPFDQSFMVWGAVPGSTTTAVVHKGQLVVDLINANQKKLVWRGVATEKLSDKKKKLVDQINRAVEKLFQKYPVARSAA